MRVVEITRPGPPDVLRLMERPDPMPGSGEVLIHVRASGVNFADVMGRMGLYPDAPKIPYVPGYEVAGLDPEGRRVIATTKFQGYADRVVVRQERVFPLPDGLSFEQGAAVPVNYLTAWVALVEMARIRKGDRILVEHGAGGVGLAALQIARHAEADVFAVTSSRDKAAFLKDQGASPIIRDHDPLPQQLDVILDPTGVSTLPRDLRLLAPGGRVILYGASEFVTGRKRNLLRAAWKYLTRPRIDPMALINQNRGLFGLNLLHFEAGTDRGRAVMEALFAGVREGWIRPHVGATFPLERAADAHAYLQDRKNIGKVVLTCGA